MPLVIKPKKTLGINDKKSKNIKAYSQKLATNIFHKTYDINKSKTIVINEINILCLLKLHGSIFKIPYTIVVYI